VLATGQSGQVLSPHYRDLVGRWRDNALVTIGPDAGPDAAQLRLTPRP
jgi:acyl-homoserine lactone acylase PvdQ